MVKWLPMNCIRIQYLFQFSTSPEVQECNLSYQLGINVVPADAFAFCSAAALAFQSNNVYAALHASTSSLLHFYGTRCYLVSTDSLLYGSEQGFAGSPVGALTGGVVMSQVAFIMQLRAANLGRKFRGRIFVPGAVTPTANGKMAATQIATMASLEGALLEPDAVDSNALTPIIVHPGTPPGYSIVQQCSFNDVLTTIRSRKVGVGS